MWSFSRRECGAPPSGRGTVVCVSVEATQLRWVVLEVGVEQLELSSSPRRILSFTLDRAALYGLAWLSPMYKITSLFLCSLLKILEPTVISRELYTCFLIMRFPYRFYKCGSIHYFSFSLHSNDFLYQNIKFGNLFANKLNDFNWKNFRF